MTLLPRGLADPITECRICTEARNAVTRAFEKSGIGPADVSFTELQDNTCYYEVGLPEEWGL